MTKKEMWNELHTNYRNERKCGFCKNKCKKMITIRQYYIDYEDNELLGRWVEKSTIIHLCKNCFVGKEQENE